MPSAAEHIGRVIDAADNEQVRFDQFMNEALYGAHGFYTSGVGRAGRRGDFITSPEIGPLFGTVIARALDAWWRDMGSPDDFHIYDVGAGPGGLARAVIAAQPDCLAGDVSRYVCVEIGEAQWATHPTGVTSMKSLPSGELRGVVLANELLDNLPFRLLVCDGVWREAWVTHRAGAFSEVLYPLSDQPDFALPAKPILGARIPWQQAVGEWVTDILRRLNGRLVVIDYSVPLTLELAQRPWRDWLRTYAGHEKGAHYLRNVAAQDITTDVCIDQIIAMCGQPDSVRSQSQFLQLWAIDELVEEGKRIWNEESARPGLRAMKMRSRISEAEALLDPLGVGGFTVMEWTKLQR